MDRLSARAGWSFAEGDAMTSDQIDLARRAVACKGWRWMPGMSARRWSGHGEVSAVARVSAPARETPWLSEGWLPDLSDPATLGCLLALVREAWGPAYGTGRPHLRPTATGWFVASCGYPVAPEGLTEAEALVAALEAAP
jgi:hypothetical protein